MENHIHGVFFKHSYEIKNIFPTPDGIIFEPKQGGSSLTVKVLCAILSLLYANFDLEQVIIQRLEKLPWYCSSIAAWVYHIG